MSKKSRRNRMKIDPHLFEAPNDMLEENDDIDFESEHLPRELQDDEWWNDPAAEERVSTRRKIERRREKQALYSELNDIEVFDRRH